MIAIIIKRETPTITPIIIGAMFIPFPQEDD